MKVSTAEEEEKGELPTVDDTTPLDRGDDEPSGETLKFPTDFPMENKYLPKMYYVRACFPIYYQLILDNLVNSDDLQFIAVTGPSGIGKSVFGGYFFDRFRREHPEFTIITASFAASSGLIKATVSESDREVVIRHGVGAYDFMGEAYEKARPKVLHLYDGPPVIPPPGQMVCFTNQDSSWHKICADNEAADKLWLPLWSPEELSTAATCLELDVTQDMIEDRFFKFGGVARQCLATDASVVVKELTALDSALDGMDVLEELRGLVYEFGQSAVHHRLCHHEPSREEPWFSAIRLASKYISLRVLQKIGDSEAKLKCRVLQFLYGIPEETVCRAHLFEMKAHALLARGGPISAYHLDDRRRSTTTFTLSSSEFCFFNSDIFSSSSESGSYQLCGTSICRSIDSFYYPFVEKKWFGLKVMKEKILLFQALVASARALNGKDIANTLEDLGLLEAAMHSPSCVLLIFIVPSSDGDKHTAKQIIQWDEKANVESIRVLASLASEEVDHLLSLDIETVGDLRKAVSSSSSLHDEILKSAEINEYALHLKNLQKVKGQMLQSISQYVWVV